MEWEVAPGRTVRTVGYNGSVPGPLLRFQEGETVTVDILNETSNLEFVHWHGFEVPIGVDGSEEEHSPGIPPHGQLRYRLTPQPSGCRYVHTHSMAMSDLNRGTFTGQFAFAWIEPKHNPGRYDQEVFLATHEWEPRLTTRHEEDSSPAPVAVPHGPPEVMPPGWEVRYRSFTINGKCLRFGEPVRVKEGQRVLFHFLNASATESVRLALPGHRFQVIALDGNPVPRPALVDLLELGTAERIDAVVTMDSPGVFVLGTPRSDHRGRGMGIVVEYANQKGKPRWAPPPRGSIFDYRVFGENRAVAKPDEVIPLVIEQGAQHAEGFETWTINGKGFDPNDAKRLSKGKRYRLAFDNRTEDVHPLHLHRHSFELTNVYGTPTAGIMKDVVLIKSYQTLEVDVTPLSEGLALFHCHQQFHMDRGFKLLFDVV
ncbi:MAG TPA: multicopper oxidase domain-containing protein [Bryobacteraceae bacterium]|nr:multicopper oxidase domain-containing protein [Bryobacteraceae bacterium]